MSNLAVLLSSQKPLTEEGFTEAKALFRQAISGREAESGRDHPSTLYTVSNLGKLLSGAPSLSLDLLQEADALHERATEALAKVLHNTHPLTLTAKHNQACHWLAFYEFQSDLSDEIELDMLRRCEDQLYAVYDA